MTTEMLKDYIVYKIYCKDIKIKDEYYGSTSAYRARKCCHKTSRTIELLFMLVPIYKK